MRWKIAAALLMGLVMAAGCAFKENRIRKFQTEHPEWSQTTVEKVAGRQVEIGMTGKMVEAALDKTDSVTTVGDEVKWGFAIWVGGFQPRQKFVYFVYLKDDWVVRTEGDRSQLAYLSWS